MSCPDEAHIGTSTAWITDTTGFGGERKPGSSDSDVLDEGVAEKVVSFAEVPVEGSPSSCRPADSLLEVMTVRSRATITLLNLERCESLVPGWSVLSERDAVT